ncbi:MAG: hypothetical protein K9M49_03335 [Candidatus Marinimicrobia bacterium]|nr:hypothetical protein [Candidatus Neomarinimicrobiota bacterium]MCF7850880.1 hypothetical protein [Candidatus Neomarinimicrobiota bacterium]MCF7904167.1 hypothetical protein [Candidatus Neomarinimicrobiota bacterium]
MKTMKTILVISLLANVVLAQVTSTLETTTARSTALAASHVASSGSAELLFTNPALLAEYEGLGFIAGYQNVFSQRFLNHSVVGFAYDTDHKFGNVGATTTTLATRSGSVNLAEETAMGLHYGNYLMQDRLSSLAIGLTLNYMQISYGLSAGPSGDGTDGSSLGSASMIGVDVGFLATLGKRHRAAALVRNINNPSMGRDGYKTALPQTLIGGFAYTPVDEVTTTFSLNYTSGHPVEFHGGLEYKLNPQFSILSGMQSQPNRLSAGLKMEIVGINIEYGVITHPVLPLTHAISMNFHIDN